MKKFLVSTMLAISVVASYGATATITIPSASGMSNILAFAGGPVKVNYVTVTATTSTNVAVVLYDTLTNKTTYTLGAYTNTTSYVTNLVTSWTNYYGVAQSTTNLTLISQVANTVAASTNNYPALPLSVLGSTTSTFDNLNQIYNYGLWVTNSGAGTATLVVNYVR